MNEGISQIRVAETKWISYDLEQWFLILTEFRNKLRNFKKSCVAQATLQTN